jgi:hypothetical protein
LVVRDVRSNQLRITVYISNNMESVSTYSEARNEYLKQLATWLVPYMVQHYRGVWADSVKIAGQQRAMVVFQEKCAEVPKWNQDMIDSNVSKLLENCRCDYLEELMAAVFIAHTKVLIAIRVSSKHKKLQITLPKLDHFIHRVFSECARSFWKAPYLFLDDQKPIEQQKNLLQAEALCTEAIASAVRSLLPIKNILNEYLAEDVSVNEPVIEEKVDSPKKSVEKDDSPKKSLEKVEEDASAEVVAPVSPPKKAPTVTDIGTESPRKRRSKEPSADNTDEETEVKVTKIDDSLDEIKEVSIGGGSDTIQIPAEPLALPSEPLTLASEPLTLASEPLAATDSNMPPSILKKTAPVEPEEIAIDTEHAVRFNNYDNVFDESKEQVASFSYAPKDLEEGEIPRLEIREETSSSLGLDADVTNLEAPGAPEQSLGLAADEILD